MKDHRVYLVHILDAVRKIRRYTAQGRKTFLADEMIQDAVVRNLEIIGEATKRIPAEVRLRYSEIPWKGMAGLRDVLIHHYEGVNLARVWAVVEHDLPTIEEAISRVLPPLDQLEREIAGEGE